MKFVLFFVCLVVSACSSGEKESSSKEFKVEVFTIDEEPVKGAYVTLYSDAGQTIEQSLLTDIDGVANFGLINREKVSFSIVKLKSAEQYSFLRGIVLYDVSAKTERFELNFQDDVFPGRKACIEENTIYLHFDEILPQDQIHYISTFDHQDYRFELKQGMPLQVCIDHLKDGKTDLLVTSRNTDDPIETTFGWAKDVEITEGKRVDIDYGIPARQIAIYSKHEPKSDKYFYDDYTIFRKGRYFQSLEAVYLDGYRLALLPDIPEVEFQLEIRTHEPDTDHDHSLYSVVNTDKDDVSIEFALNRPEVGINSENEIYWSIEGQEPSYVSSNFMGHEVVTNGTTYDLFWSFAASSKVKNLRFPDLPEELSIFQHTPISEYSYKRFHAQYSKSYNSRLERFLFHTGLFQSGHLPEYEEESWSLEIN